MDEESKPQTAFTVGPLGFQMCKRMLFGLMNAPATFQRLMETCLGGPQSPLVYHLFGWHSHLLQGSAQPPQEARGCVPEIGEGRTKTPAFQMCTISTADCLLGACDFCQRSSHWWRQNRSYHEMTNIQKHHRGLMFLGFHGILLSFYP